MVFTLLIAAAALLCTFEFALGGPNANGVLVIHSTGIAASTDAPDRPCRFELESCWDVDPNASRSSVPMLWTVHAFFGREALPRVAAVTFGVGYDDSSIFVTDYGRCGDFEIPMHDWPGPFSGTAITFSQARTERSIMVSWFYGYEYYGHRVSFDLRHHPTQGGRFADDSVPAEEDDIAWYGSLGFNGYSVYVECLDNAPPMGACCFCPDSACFFRSRSGCEEAGGEFQGEDTSCDPNPCECPTLGACCVEEQPCEITAEADCLGLWLVEAPCDPDPCSILPTIETSWGRLKNLHR